MLDNKDRKYYIAKQKNGFRIWLRTKQVLNYYLDAILISLIIDHICALTKYQNISRMSKTSFMREHNSPSPPPPYS